MLVTQPEDEFLLQADRRPLLRAQSWSCLHAAGKALGCEGRRFASALWSRRGGRALWQHHGWAARPRSRSLHGEQCPGPPPPRQRGGAVSRDEGSRAAALGESHLGLFAGSSAQADAPAEEGQSAPERGPANPSSALTGAEPGSRVLSSDFPPRGMLQ